MSRKLIFKDSIDGCQYLVKKMGPYDTNINCPACFRWNHIASFKSNSVNCAEIDNKLQCRSKIKNWQYFYFKLIKFKKT